MNDLKLPSIFNDVIGPVMRGPSSSHTAASWRIAKTSLAMLNDNLVHALIEFDRNGAWAPNYREQGTCMGVEGGLLGFDIIDEKMKETELYLKKESIEIKYQVSSFATDHANTVKLTLIGRSGKRIQIVAVSLGGGSFEIRSFNDFEVSINGDLFVMIFNTKEKLNIPEKLKEYFAQPLEIHQDKKKGLSMYECRSSDPFDPVVIAQLQDISGIQELILVDPVMPVIAGRQQELPFNSVSSLLAYAEKSKLDLGELGLMYEKYISGMTEEELNKGMNAIIDIIHGSIDNGLKGTYYKDRILKQQSHLIARAEKEGKVKDSIVNRIIANVSALMESKSSMEVVVAVPTAGSCGTVGGVLRAVAEDISTDQQALVSAYFAAGIVGVFFAQGPGFSAEEHGCQVECGAASGMAAAAIVQLMGGNAEQALGAASMAIQNMIGLVCDPVADRVEVPCLGKNTSAAVNAYSSAIMAISGFDAVIPLNQVIQTVSKVSATMPTCVKCTGKGGLAITEQSIKIKEKLKGF